MRNNLKIMLFEDNLKVTLLKIKQTGWRKMNKFVFVPIRNVPLREYVEVLQSKICSYLLLFLIAGCVKWVNKWVRTASVDWVRLQFDFGRCLTKLVGNRWTPCGLKKYNIWLVRWNTIGSLLERVLWLYTWLVLTVNVYLVLNLHCIK